MVSQYRVAAIAMAFALPSPTILTNLRPVKAQRPDGEGAQSGVAY